MHQGRRNFLFEQSANRIMVTGYTAKGDSFALEETVAVAAHPDGHVGPSVALGARPQALRGVSSAIEDTRRRQSFGPRNRAELFRRIAPARSPCAKMKKGGAPKEAPPFDFCNCQQPLGR